MNSDLGNKKEKAASHPKPTKSQVRTKLHYYPVTLFWLADDFKMVFKELIYMDFDAIRLQCNRIFGKWQR